MPKVIFRRKFRFSPNGFDVVDYLPSDEAVEVSDRCAEVALAVGAAEQPAKSTKSAGQGAKEKG